ncbi:MAG: hypothetical protein ACFFDI_33575, partial [Promethearchaeota archaeon]
FNNKGISIEQQMSIVIVALAARIIAIFLLLTAIFSNYTMTILKIAKSIEIGTPMHSSEKEKVDFFL